MAQELVVVFAEAPAAFAPGAEALDAPAAAASSLDQVLGAHGVQLMPMFEQPTAAPSAAALDGAEAAAEASSAAGFEAEMGRYYHAEVGEDGATTLAAQLRALPEVETAYVKAAVENPLAPDHTAAAAFAAAPPAGPAVAIPPLRQMQGYLDAAPGGVDAAAAWALPGGRGANVRVIDIEGGWCFSHLDLRVNAGGLLAGVAFPGQDWRDHGTAVLGEISGDDNSFGVVGIAPDAIVSAVSHNGLGSARAIQVASTHLRAGDILLLEMHRPGPRHGFLSRPDQKGYIAVEWWPDDFLAIAAATARGVIVVEAAGNGAEDLDSVLYDTPGSGFPASWRNPFRGARDSGAIVVGAGAPPSGAHGPDRSRLGFSNHGDRVDCQGWGREVTTTGYGDLFQGLSEDFWYTDSFSGTSSASPIVTGVLACLQGISRARGRLLAPAQARTLLRSHGSPQTASPTAPLSQRIGPRPDLSGLVRLVP